MIFPVDDEDADLVADDQELWLRFWSEEFGDYGLDDMTIQIVIWKI